MIDFSQIALVSSNDKKLKEYSQFGLPLVLAKNIDLKEVDGTPLEVIIHKAIEAGENKLVEDVSLYVQGSDVGVNIKWLSDKIKTDPSYNGKRATWTVMLGLVHNDQIYIAQGVVDGAIDQSNFVIDAFGFDSVFVPKGSKKTLHQLVIEGKKDLFSARKKAINNLLKSKFFKVMKRSEIPSWTGSYQNET